MWVAQQISCTLGIYITIPNSSKVTVLKQKQDNFMGEVSTTWRSVLKALGLGTACTPLLADWARLASSGIGRCVPHAGSHGCLASTSLMGLSSSSQPLTLQAFRYSRDLNLLMTMLAVRN